MFFVNVASLIFFFDVNEFSIPFYVISSGVVAPLLSFQLIFSSIKLSAINLKKIDYNLIDNITEGEKDHSVLPNYFNLFVMITIVLYSVVGYYSFNQVYVNQYSLLDAGKLEVQELLFFGFLILVNLYYFIQMLRINILIKKYGVIKGKL